MDASTLSALAGALKQVGGTLLGGMIGGPAGAAIAPVIIGALADALGADKTPEAVTKAIMDNPDLAGPVVQRVEANQGDTLKELELRLGDVKDARAQTIQLVQAGSAMAWGSPVVSVIVVLGFLGALFMVMGRPMTMDNAQSTILNILIGTLGASFTQVVNYYLGSSAGSAAKDQRLAQIETPTAGQIAGKAIDAVSKAGKSR
jgi:hypothetical protein